VIKLQDNTGQWDSQKLVALFGQQGAREIANTVAPLNQTHLRPDRMIWKVSTKGCYTVREGYQMLAQADVTIQIEHSAL
jgi:hypothetical protein